MSQRSIFAAFLIFTASSSETVLSSFPQELFLDILDVIDDVPGDDRVVSLRSCSLVSRAWRYIAQARLFADIRLRTSTKVSGFAALLNGSPHIVPFIRALSVEPDGPHSDYGHDAFIVRHAWRLPSLTTLQLIKPAFYLMNGRTRDAFAYGFQTVQSFHFIQPVFYNDGRDYLEFLECCLGQPRLKSFWLESDQNVKEGSVTRSPGKYSLGANLEVMMEELTLKYASKAFLLSFELLCTATGSGARKVSLTLDAAQLGPAACCLSALRSSVEELELTVYGVNQGPPTDLKGR